MAFTTRGSHIKNFHGFGIYDKKVREYLIKLNDKNPYFRSIVLDTSFSRKVLNYKPDQRYKGSTKNNLFTLIDIGLLGIMTSSQLPLKFAVACGFCIGILSMLASVVYLFLKNNLLGHLSARSCTFGYWAIFSFISSTYFYWFYLSIFKS